MTNALSIFFAVAYTRIKFTANRFPPRRARLNSKFDVQFYPECHCHLLKMQFYKYINFQPWIKVTVSSAEWFILLDAQTAILSFSCGYIYLDFFRDFIVLQSLRFKRHFNRNAVNFICLSFCRFCFIHDSCGKWNCH